MNLVIFGPKTLPTNAITRQVAKTLKRKHISLLKEIEYQENKLISKVPEMQIKKREKYIVRSLAKHKNIVINVLEKTLLSEDNFKKLTKQGICIALLIDPQEYKLDRITKAEELTQIQEAYAKRQQRITEKIPNQITIQTPFTSEDKKAIKMIAKEIVALAETIDSSFLPESN